MDLLLTFKAPGNAGLGKPGRVLSSLDYLQELLLPSNCTSGRQDLTHQWDFHDIHLMLTPFPGQQHRGNPIFLEVLIHSDTTGW